MSPIQYNGDVVVTPDDCPECGGSLYDSTCDASGCPGRGCQHCGWGCDLEFLSEDDSRCAQSLAREDPDDYAARIREERTFWGMEEPDV